MCYVCVCEDLMWLFYSCFNKPVTVIVSEKDNDINRFYSIYHRYKCEKGFLINSNMRGEKNAKVSTKNAFFLNQACCMAIEKGSHGTEMLPSNNNSQPKQTILYWQ